MAALGRTLQISVAQDGTSFTLALFDGMEPAALLHAVAMRLRCPSSFFLTATPDPGSTVVPLSAVLPDGVSLTLHHATPPSACISNSSSLRDDAQPAVGSRKSTLESQDDASIALQVPEQRKFRGWRSVSEPMDVGSPKRTPDAYDEASRPLLQQEQRTSGGWTSASAPFEGLGRRKRMRSVSEALSRQSSRESVVAAGPFQRRLSWTDFAIAKEEECSESSCTSQQHVAEQEAMEEVEETLDAVERFSRLSTDLANERTLLAWNRTCLAAIRTAFTYWAVAGTSSWWNTSVVLSQFLMAVLIIVLAGTGHSRYDTIKQVLSQKVPPCGFGRTSIRYMKFLVLCAALITTLGIVSQQWKKS